jgi:DNA-directed RNA polymerase subunit N (RpoN/RPB10)
MIYPICPTCKHRLADIQEQYDRITGQINNDIEAGKFTKEKGDELRKKFTNNLDLNRYCCKQRVVCYRELIKIVK